MTSPSDRRYVSVTECKDFLKDRWRWYAAWVRNRVPRKTAPALTLGKAFHRVMERHHADNVPILDALHFELFTLERDAHDAIRVGRYEDADTILSTKHALAGLTPHLTAFRDEWPLEETLEVERPFEKPLVYLHDREWWFRGRPDRVGVRDGKVWHVQNRTIDGKKNLGLYLELAARDMHENLYGWGLLYKYPKWPYGGTILNIVRKLKADRNKPGALWFQQPVAIEPATMQRAVLRLRAIVDEMAASEEIARECGHDALIDNPGLDGGWYGNSKDPYVDVLFGRTTLDDDELFKAREETYEVAET